MPRFYCPTALIPGELLDLAPGPARHVQVLRLQPGDTITLFNGGPGLPTGASVGGEFDATVTQMGRSQVQVRVGEHQPVEREAVREVHLVVGMPANERMDWLVEKATELGVASVQPVMTERSVLKLTGERADKKVAHWQSVATAACEQCGGNRVPVIHAVMGLQAWLKARAAATAPAGADADAGAGGHALLLSLRAGSLDLREAMQRHDHDHGQGAARAAGSALGAVTFLSGPEGGLSRAEEDAALACGLAPVTLGPRVLRSETAALAALVALLV